MSDLWKLVRRPLAKFAHTLRNISFAATASNGLIVPRWQQGAEKTEIEMLTGFADRSFLLASRIFRTPPFRRAAAESAIRARASNSPSS
jgi:hypothetical protein